MQTQIALTGTAYAPQLATAGLAEIHQKITATHPTPPPSKPRVRRTMRTVMFDDEGKLIDAQIDLEHGEITPHDYKDSYSARPAVRIKGQLSETEPPWVLIPAPVRGKPGAGAGGKPRKSVVNTVKMYLTDYLCFKDALEDLPMLDNIIVGASQLDFGGNTRPVSCSLLFHPLQNLDVITAAAVLEARGCSVRHSQKLAKCLRIIVAAFYAEANRSYPQADS